MSDERFDSIMRCAWAMSVKNKKCYGEAVLVPAPNTR